jgi:hypothetical protein
VFRFIDPLPTARNAQIVRVRDLAERSLPVTREQAAT